MLLKDEVSEERLKEFKLQCAYYAKHNCKNCYGRGYHEYTLPNRVAYCKCVIKIVKRINDGKNV